LSAKQSAFCLAGDNVSMSGNQTGEWWRYLQHCYAPPSSSPVYVLDRMQFLLHSEKHKIFHPIFLLDFFFQADIQKSSVAGSETWMKELQLHQMIFHMITVSGVVQSVDFKLVDLCLFVLRYSHIVVVLLQGI
jgi:hypothetical protein